MGEGAASEQARRGGRTGIQGPSPWTQTVDHRGLLQMVIENS